MTKTNKKHSAQGTVNPNIWLNPRHHIQANQGVERFSPMVKMP